MAGTSLLALLDDIATVLDDVAVLSKVAAKKTAGVLGDDLALNAQQVAGVRAEREIPVVWAVAKGSFLNKLILVPAALAISVFLPWLIMPLMMIGGTYLCFEGAEKIVHHLLHPKDVEKNKKEVTEALTKPNVDLVKFEKNKIKGAIRTDFILSAEIIVIALGIVQEAAFWTQVAVVSSIAISMTVAVYGLVAGIVKLDDAGFYLVKKQQDTLVAKMQRSLGRGLLVFAPFLMKSLSIVGTAAMFLVGGGILLHGIPVLEPMVHQFEVWVTPTPVIGGLLKAIASSLVGALLGIIAGCITLAVVSLIIRLKGDSQKSKA